MWPVQVRLRELGYRGRKDNVMVDHIKNDETAVYRAFAQLNDNTNDEVVRAVSSIEDVSRLRRTNKAAKENAVAVQRMRVYETLISAPWNFDIDEIDTIQGINLSRRKINDDHMRVFATAIASGALGSLQKLYLHYNAIGDAGLTAFADAIKPSAANPRGSLGQLTFLSMHANRIGDSGMQAFASAVASGALGSLVKLWLEDNHIGDEGMQAFSSAIATGALKALKGLVLAGNKIGDAGMMALSDAIGKGASGALGSLVELRLQQNRIGDEGMKAFSSAIATGALASLSIVLVDDGPLGVDHPQLWAACHDRGITLR